MFSTFIPRYSSFLPPESGSIFIVFTMRTYANFDKIQNYILLNFDKYDFTNNAHIPVASFRQKAGFLQNHHVLAHQRDGGSRVFDYAIVKYGRRSRRV